MMLPARRPQVLGQLCAGHGAVPINEGRRHVENPAIIGLEISRGIAGDNGRRFEIAIGRHIFRLRKSTCIHRHGKRICELTA
jgi:hypothetical protein